MILVVDASVALKWFFDTRDDEAHVDTALAILDAVGEGAVSMLEPPHFLAEIAAVLAREKPRSALVDLRDLQLVEWEIADDPALFDTAVELCVRSGQHLFDTLYHAVALHVEDAMLVTADDRYFGAANDAGRIVRLPELQLSA